MEETIDCGLIEDGQYYDCKEDKIKQHVLTSQIECTYRKPSKDVIWCFHPGSPKLVIESCGKCKGY